MRAIPVTSSPSTSSTCPAVIAQLAEEERGIILLTGTTGSGKSTTLAAMIDHINRTMHKHIVTIEDPIEFLHRDRNSIINQREVGQDTASFKRALRRVLRQDPDVILVGEMRDEETVQTALSAAETGHLVLSTLHTVDAPETINRIIDFFPPHQQQQARAMIAGTLKGIISQRLVPTADGKGRVATCEIMVMTGRVHDMIIDPKQTGQLGEVVAEGGYYGMQTFDQHLLEHLNAGRITLEDATRAASSPHDFKLMVAAQARIHPRSHPNKGEGRIDGAPTDAMQVSPAPTDAQPAAPAPAPRPPSRPRRLPRSRRRRHRRRRLRRLPRAAQSPFPPARPRAAADAVGAAARHPVLNRLTHLRPAERFGRSFPDERTCQVQTTLAQFNETQSTDAFALQNSKLLKVSLNQVTIQAKLGSMVAYQGEVSFEHAGSGGLGRMLKKAVSGEGTSLMRMNGTR